MFTKSMIVCSTAIILGVAAMAPAVAANSKAGKQSFAQAPSSNSSYDVYLNGQYVGSDPDPRIRWSILREVRSGSRN